MIDVTPAWWVLGVVAVGYVVFLVVTLVLGRRARLLRDERQHRRGQLAPTHTWVCSKPGCDWIAAESEEADLHEQLRGHEVVFIVSRKEEQET